MHENLLSVGITGLTAGATDRRVRAAVLKTVNNLVSQEPTQNHIDKNLTIAKGSRFQQALFAINKNFSHTAPGSIAISFVGEDHTLLADKERAEALLAQATQDGDGPYLIMFERGMDYPTD